MLKRNRMVAFVLAFVVIVFELQAQVNLRGLVTDKKTGEALIGASIYVGGLAKSAGTDVDGKFEIRSVPAGTYDIKISYVSYQPLQLMGVVVEADKDKVLEIQMESAEVSLRDVQVVGVRRTNTDLAMLNSTKLNSLAVSAISSQQISKSLDRDAGEVVKRVAGVTIMDGRFVVIRGLGQRYNNVWLNDVSTPSSEADSRAFSFDAIPGGVIDNLVLYKTPAPEIPADFSGGFVKVFTKNLPDKNSFQFSFGTAFHQGSTGADFKSGETTPADWFGLGSASRALPTSFPSLLTYDMTNSELVKHTESLNTGWNTHLFKALPDVRLSATLNRTFSIGSLQLGTITAVNYSNAFRTYRMENKRYGIYQKNLDKPFARNNYLDDQYNQDSKFGVLHNWSFVFGDRNRIEFRNFFNQIGKNRYTHRVGEDNNNDYNIREIEVLNRTRSTYSGQLGGKHTFEKMEMKLDWVLGYSYANRYEPDRKIMTSRMNENEYSPDSGKYATDGNDVKRNYQKLDEHIVSSGINLEKRLVFGSFTPTLKAGVFAEQKSRTFSARNFKYAFKTNLLPAGFIYNDFADMFTSANIQTTGVLLDEASNKSDSYSASNLIASAYLATNLKFGDLLEVYAGVRMEHDDLQLDGYESDGTDPVQVNKNQLNYFPSINATVHITEKNQVRVAYGSSINRPEFRELAPYVYYDFEKFSGFEGNPNLKDATIQNLDFRYEYYPTSSEMISFAAFYKRFDNPIEISYFEVGGNQQYTYKNAQSARNYGIEVDIRKNLTSLGLEHFTLLLNGSLISSKVLFAAADFERDRAMQGQSPWLTNVGLYYDNEDSGWKSSLMYNSIGKRIASVGVVNQDISEDLPDVYELTRHVIDFSLTKKLTDRMEFNVGVKDLLNQAILFKQFPRFVDANGVTQKREQTTMSYKPGRNISLSLSIKL